MEPARVQVYIPQEDLRNVKIKMLDEYGKSNVSELTRKLFKKYLDGEIDLELDI